MFLFFSKYQSTDTQQAIVSSIVGFRVYWLKVLLVFTAEIWEKKGNLQTDTNLDKQWPD